MAYKIGKCLLRHQLRRAKMSQSELALHVNKSKQTISKYVNNAQVMSLESAINISKVLNCKIEDLYEVIKE